MNAPKRSRSFVKEATSVSNVTSSSICNENETNSQHVTALRHWLDITLVMYSTGGLGISLPRKPLGMMLLAHLWIQSSRSASYADLRAAFKLKDSSSLSHAIKRLTKAGYVEGFASNSDTRTRALRLLKSGGDVVDRVLNVAFPSKDT